MRHSFNNYPAPRPEDNELYSQFKYTPLKGFDYNNGDGTVSRRDPTKVIFENGKYHIWYGAGTKHGCHLVRNSTKFPRADLVR